MQPALSSHRNSLDALRLGAAMLVLYSHQHAILGLPEPSFLGWNTWGGAGVSIFFVLSGYLVWTSWLRDPRVVPFLARRSLRIFPALWVVVLLSALVVGPWASVLSTQRYFNHPQTWQYLDNMVLSVVYGLPGVFPANALPGIVNGSLWSLPVEFICYLVLAAAGWSLVCTRVPVRAALAGLWWLAVAVASWGTYIWGPAYLMHCEMVAFFAAGVLYGQMRHAPFDRLQWVLVVLGLAAFAGLGGRGPERLGMLLMALTLVHGATAWTGGAGLGARLGDLSYGVYIYAFPVQQALAHWGQGQNVSFASMLGLASGLTLLLAYLSWHGIEKRALAFKPRSGVT